VAETFIYKARDASGTVRTGTTQGDSQMGVAAGLRDQGLTPLTIDLTDKAANASREVKIPGLGRPKKVKLKDLAVFSRQFATMINSGLSLLRALNILADQTESKELARLVGEVRSDVERGTSLSASLANHPKGFNRLYVSMVRAGESGGILDDVLVRLAETLEKQVALKQKIKSAMTYPVVVFLMVIGIVSAMLIFVVPMFTDLYKDLGGKLPLPTQVLISVSAVISKFSYILVAGAVAGSWAFRKYVATEKGRFQADKLLLKAPVFGPLFHKTALSRFARTLAVLMRSGVPILQALEIVSETAGNEVMARAVIEIKTSVKEGETIAKPMSHHKIFPPMVVQMLAVGEETGAMDSMLEKLADFYDQEIEAMVAALTSLIEPLLIAFMGAAVGGMVVALYMPMFNIINLVK
jgi:type IV pilus assembly protein PilC